MHHRLEVILPQPDGFVFDEAGISLLETTLGPLLEPFSEYAPEEIASTCTFFDYWIIGGRWSGDKLIARLDPDTIAAFNAELNSMKLTISAVQAGKPSLQPESQADQVNDLWQRYFPDCLYPCPYFMSPWEHTLSDICTVGQIPDGLTAHRVMIFGPTYRGFTTLHTHYAREVWLGSNYMKTDWDGNVMAAIHKHQLRFSNDSDFARKARVQDDWLSVTVDYHS